MKTEKSKKSSGLTPAQRSAFFRALQAASIELGHATPEGEAVQDTIQDQGLNQKKQRSRK